MQRKPLRRTLQLLVVAFILCLANCTRVMANTPIRLVDMVSLVALGIVIGAIISNVALYFRLRYHENEQ
jgi:hypothetical protein